MNSPWPVGLEASFALIPKGQPVSLLCRHGERFPIVDGSFGAELSLTEKGLGDAFALGQVLPLPLVAAFASPLKRCHQTASQILAGAQSTLTITPSNLLLDGFFTNRAQAETVLAQRQLKPILLDLVQGVLVEGLEALPVGASRVLELVFAPLTNGLSLFTSHDHIIALLLHYLLKLKEFNSEYWPGYLEGLLFWKEGSRQCWAFRGQKGVWS